jgi:tripartite-type tricarboxylate transporter receptor subunit TctC
MIAAQALHAAAPDGYTIMQTLAGLTEVLPNGQQLPLDPIRDFTLITPMFQSLNYVIVRADLRANSLTEYLALAKTTPGGLTYGDNSIASPPGLMMAMIKAASGAPIELVHYRASAEAMNDMITGRLDSGGNAFNTFASALENGKIRVLAANSLIRTRRFPNIPTVGEAGHQGGVVLTWWGLIGPAGLPRPLAAGFMPSSARRRRTWSWSRNSPTRTSSRGRCRPISSWRWRPRIASAWARRCGS